MPALRSLRLIGFTDWPSDVHEDGDFEATTLRILQSYATSAFTAVPKLKALSFSGVGEESWYYDENGPFKPPCYTRGHIIDCRSRETVMAIETSPHEMLDYEPCSEILNMQITQSGVLRYGYKP